MPESGHLYREIRAAKKRRRLKTLRLAVLLGIVASGVVALAIYGLYRVSRF